MKYALLFSICLIICAILIKLTDMFLPKKNRENGRFYIFFNTHFSKIICSIIISFAIIFLIGNFISSGAMFDELFYKIKQDFGLDFFVFLSDSVLGKDAYTQNLQTFNPPLIKLISLFFYHSMSPDVQMLYAEGALTKGVPDIRLQIQAVLPFIYLILFSCMILFLSIFSKRKASISDKLFFIIISVINIGFIYAIERGNFVMISYPLAMLFIATYRSENKLVRELGLISLGVCAGIKLYPCLYGLILLKDKQYKSAIRACIYGTIMIFGPFIYFNGADGIMGFINSLVGNSEQGALRLGTLNFTSYSGTLMKMFGSTDEVIIDNMQSIKIFSYILFVPGAFLIFLFKDKWKSVALITIMMILYTGTSHTYMLSYLTLPFLIFVEEKKNLSPITILYSIYFILLISILYVPTPSYLVELRGETDRVTLIMIVHQIVIYSFYITLLVDGYLSFLMKYNKYGKYTLKKTINKIHIKHTN